MAGKLKLWRPTSRCPSSSRELSECVSTQRLYTVSTCRSSETAICLFSGTLNHTLGRREAPLPASPAPRQAATPLARSPAPTDVLRRSSRSAVAFPTISEQHRHRFDGYGHSSNHVLCQRLDLECFLFVVMRLNVHPCFHHAVD